MPGSGRGARRQRTVRRRCRRLCVPRDHRSQIEPNGLFPNAVCTVTTSRGTESSGAMICHRHSCGSHRRPAPLLSSPPSVWAYEPAVGFMRPQARSRSRAPDEPFGKTGTMDVATALGTYLEIVDSVAPDMVEGLYVVGSYALDDWQ